MIESPPRRIHRVFAAAAVASIAALLAWLEPLAGRATPDFGQVWFAARALLHGGNPYDLIGPGKVYHLDFNLLYPLTSSAAILPLGLLSEVPATVIFVWASTAILVYGLTRNGWQRMPVFLSSAFFFAARRGQWSPVITSAWFIPSMGWILAAKPNIGLAMFMSMSSARMMKSAVIGGSALCLIALALAPTWPADWLHQLSSARHMGAPITARGGFVVLLALLRWRRPEARLLLALACIPHSMYWYDILPLMVIPATFRESVVFSLVSTTGLVFEQILLQRGIEGMALLRDFNAVIIAVAYLPATILVLRRPNVGGFPWTDRRAARSEKSHALTS
jgi:hypothetical protein